MCAAFQRDNAYQVFSSKLPNWHDQAAASDHQELRDALEAMINRPAETKVLLLDQVEQGVPAEQAIKAILRSLLSPEVLAQVKIPADILAAYADTCWLLETESD